MTAFPNLHALAYGEGGQRLSAELRVEAADALERLSRTYETCADWGRYTPSLGECASEAVFVDGLLQTEPTHACNAWQPIPLTPAHDKEKP